MSLWQRLLGGQDKPKAKSVSFMGPTSELSSIVMGYPGWPIFDSYGAMYQRQPAVRTVVDFLSKNVAQLNPKIYARTSDTDRREWNDHPLAELLRNPSPTTTRFAHLRDTVADIAIYDRAYWRMLRARGGLLSALVRIPPSRVTIEVDQKTLKTTYRFDGEVITRDQMVIFHGYHPDGGELGVSPLETLRRVLSEEWAATTHREWFWRNAARQSGVIERPIDAPEWSNDARKRFREGWESTMAGGTNSGRTAILEEGMKWNTAAFSPKDSEYIEGRKLTYTEVARVYAPALVGLFDEGGKTAVESFHRQLYQDVLAPVLRMLQDEIDGQLLTLDEYPQVPAYCEFNLADKLKGSFEEQGRTLVTSVGVPYMSVNEGRARLNLPRIDDDLLDVPVQPLNVLYGGQPSVLVPTADPGNPSTVGGPGMVPGVGMATPRELAEIVQKIYLGVGVVLTAEEAREILNLASASLSGSLPAVSTGVRAFVERQQKTIRDQLGALKDQGELSVLAVWQEARWNRELSKVYQNIMTLEGADTIAALVNTAHRQAVAEAFSKGGLDAVAAVFDEAKERAEDFVFWLRQPALVA